MAKRTPNRVFSEALLVKEMTISRWRTGKNPPPAPMKLLAKILHERGELTELPDWLKGEK